MTTSREIIGYGDFSLRFIVIAIILFVLESGTLLKLFYQHRCRQKEILFENTAHTLVTRGKREGDVYVIDIVILVLEVYPPRTDRPYNLPFFFHFAPRRTVRNVIYIKQIGHVILYTYTSCTSSFTRLVCNNYNTIARKDQIAIMMIIIRFNLFATSV